MALHKCFEVNFLKEKKTMKNELTHQPGTAHLFYSNWIGNGSLDKQKIN